jgi:CBS domain-containing protein
MKVEAIYHPRVMSVRPDERLEVATARMQDSQVRSLVVLAGNQLRGILTEHDIARAVADGVDVGVASVWEYMTQDPLTVSLDTDVREVVAAMLEFDFRHLPVVQAGAVVGMVSLRDLLRTVLAAA